LNYKNLSDEFKNYVEDIERYFEEFVKEDEKDKYRSSCNAIVPIQYRPLHSNKPDNSIYEAMNHVERSLRTLIRFKYYYVGGHSEHASVSKDTYILANSDLEYRNAPLFHDGSYFDPPFKMPEEKNRLLISNLAWIHSLSPSNDLHRKIIDILNAFNKYLNRPDVFSFKDFWIEVCDPLFPNDISGFLDFAKRATRHYLKRRYEVNIKIQLSDALKAQPFQEHSYYTLTETEMKDLGLVIKYLSPISSKGFSRNYHKIPSIVNVALVEEILSEVDSFVKDNNSFSDDLDSWVEKTVFECYAERNLEVHNNLRTDLSLLKLRETCIQLTNVLLIVLSEKVKRKTSCISQVAI
jgi:ribosome-associated translation inhibitor RaiA